MAAEHITATINVKGTARDMFSLCSHYELFPQFMDSISLVSRDDDTTSHWEIDSMLGRKIKSTAVVIEFQEDKRISWETTAKELNTNGYVTFTPLLNNETAITIFISYSHPFGLLGELVLELFSEPQLKLEEALARFKDYVEGTIPLTYKEDKISEEASMEALK